MNLKPVKSKSKNIQATVNFIVTANYNMPSRSSDAKAALDHAKTVATDGDKRRWLAVMEVIQEEERIPQNLSLLAYTLKSDGSRDQPLGTKQSVTNIPSSDLPIDNYQVTPRDSVLEDHRSEL